MVYYLWKVRKGNMKYRYRVLVTPWQGKSFNKYFFNKTSAIEYFNFYKKSALSIQYLYFNGKAWVCKKFFL